MLKLELSKLTSKVAAAKEIKHEQQLLQTPAKPNKDLEESSAQQETACTTKQELVIWL